MIENEGVHITESGAMYSELVQYLENAVENLAEFVKGRATLSFCNRAKLNLSPVFRSLITDWEHDPIVLICLQALLPALCQLCKRLFKDFLPGGLWHNSTENTKMKTTGVPKHNKFSESIFGHMDRLIREKPNTTQIALEANIMFVHNKTMTWLKSKSDR